MYVRIGEFSRHLRDATPVVELGRKRKRLFEIGDRVVPLAEVLIHARSRCEDLVVVPFEGRAWNFGKGLIRQSQCFLIAVKTAESVDLGRDRYGGVGYGRMRSGYRNGLVERFEPFLVTMQFYQACAIEAGVPHLSRNVVEDLCYPPGREYFLLRGRRIPKEECSNPGLRKGRLPSIATATARGGGTRSVSSLEFRSARGDIA